MGRGSGRTGGRNGIDARAQQAAEATDRLTAAHQALLSDASVQFSLLPAPPPPPPPAWLKALFHWLGDVLAPVGRFFGWLGSFLPDAPYARIILWSVLAAAAIALAWIVYERLRYGIWRLPRRRRPVLAEGAADDDWQPDAAPARAWLEEADLLAKDGRYAEAVHHLLIRSVEDIQRRRPQALRPAFTSRNIAENTAIPAAPRRLFADIAAVVERSLFGGRAVDAQDWSACRSRYADFAQPRAWKR